MLYKNVTRLISSEETVLSRIASLVYLNKRSRRLRSRIHGQKTPKFYSPVTLTRQHRNFALLNLKYTKWTLSFNVSPSYSFYTIDSTN